MHAKQGKSVLHLLFGTQMEKRKKEITERRYIVF